MGGKYIFYLIYKKNLNKTIKIYNILETLIFASLILLSKSNSYDCEKSSPWHCPNIKLCIHLNLWKSKPELHLTHGMTLLLVATSLFTTATFYAAEFFELFFHHLLFLGLAHGESLKEFHQHVCSSISSISCITREARSRLLTLSQIQFQELCIST